MHRRRKSCLKTSGRLVCLSGEREGNPRLSPQKREVILCGGAFNSPQLLMLSGIGDPGELKQHGVEVRHALPGVGKNLQDHLDLVLAYKSQDTELVGLGVFAFLAHGG